MVNKFTVTMISKHDGIKFEFPNLESTLGFIGDYETKTLVGQELRDEPPNAFRQILIIREPEE